MANVVMYSTPWCPYCQRAHALLSSKGAKIQNINVYGNQALRDEMEQRSGGGTTVPQIWIGDRHVGGCDDLYELESKGELDPLLSA